MDYTPTELLEMSEAEARAEFDDEEFSEWEKLVELHAEADESEGMLEAEAEQVADLTVRADPEALGTRVDVFGNSLLVRMNPENEQLLNGIRALESKYEDVTPDSVNELDGAMTEDLGDRMLDMLDAVIVKWDDTRWDDLSDGQRQSVLDDVRSKWQVDGLLRAWGQIADATTENREDNMDVVESFRQEARSGPD